MHKVPKKISLGKRNLKSFWLKTFKLTVWNENQMLGNPLNAVLIGGWQTESMIDTVIEKVE